MLQIMQNLEKDSDFSHGISISNFSQVKRVGDECRDTFKNNCPMFPFFYGAPGRYILERLSTNMGFTLLELFHICHCCDEATIGDAFTSRRARRRPRPHPEHRHCHRRGPLQRELRVTQLRKSMVRQMFAAKFALT